MIGAQLLQEIIARNVLDQRVLIQMEGTAHIDFPKFETAEAINFKIFSVMHK